MDPESNDDARDPKGRYVRLPELLGYGAFKFVYRAIDTELGLEVAWNQVKLTGTQVDFKKLLQEVKVLQELSHSRIIQVYDSWTTERNLVFTTELMTSGTLKQFLRKTKNVKLKVIKGWCKQILEGLNYLHTRNPPIIHRDIKCDNIFINGSLGELKIGDLGLARAKRKDSNVLTVIGTPEYMAPEFYDEKYSEKVDIWAFGLSVLEMVTQECPFSELDSAAKIFKKVSSGGKPAALERIKDKEVRAFIELCLLPQEERPSAGELLNHPFLLPKPEDNRPVELGDLSIPAKPPQASDKPLAKADRTEHAPKEAAEEGPAAEEENQSESEEEDTSDSEEDNEKGSQDGLSTIPDFWTLISTEEGEENAMKVETAESEADDQTYNHKFSLEFLPDESSTDSVSFKLVYSRSGTDNRIICFPYDLKVDTPEAVAQEMVSGLDLLPDLRDPIAYLIKHQVLAVQVHRAKHIALQLKKSLNDKQLREHLLRSHEANMEFQRKWYELSARQHRERSELRARQKNELKALTAALRPKKDGHHNPSKLHSHHPTGQSNNTQRSSPSLTGSVSSSSIPTHDSPSAPLTSPRSAPDLLLPIDANTLQISQPASQVVQHAPAGHQETPVPSSTNLFLGLAHQPSVLYSSSMTPLPSSLSSSNNPTITTSTTAPILSTMSSTPMIPSSIITPPSPSPSPPPPSPSPSYDPSPSSGNRVTPMFARSSSVAVGGQSQLKYLNAKGPNTLSTSSSSGNMNVYNNLKKGTCTVPKLNPEEISSKIDEIAFKSLGSLSQLKAPSANLGGSHSASQLPSVFNLPASHGVAPQSGVVQPNSTTPSPSPQLPHFTHHAAPHSNPLHGLTNAIGGFAQPGGVPSRLQGMTTDFV